MVLAEYSQETGAGIPGSAPRGDRDGMVFSNVSFAYWISWIGIIASAIPGTEN